MHMSTRSEKLDNEAFSELSKVKVPQTVLALRGSHGVALVPGISSSLSHGSASERALSLKACKLQYIVDVTLVSPRRDGHFFQICCNLQYKSKLFLSDVSRKQLGSQQPAASSHLPAASSLE